MREFDGPCPIEVLLGPEADAVQARAGVSPSAQAAALLAAIVAVGADGSGGPERFGAALVHMLDHDFELRPAVAKAVVEHIPRQVERAKEKLGLYLRNRFRDPLVQARPYLITNEQAWERLGNLVAMGYLDPARIPEATDCYAGTPDPRRHVGFFAGLGDAQAVLAIERLIACGDRWMAESGNLAMLRGCAADLLELPPRHLPAVRAALEAWLDRGLAVGMPVWPLTSLHPEYREVGVAVALRSMLLEPLEFLPAAGRLLADRTDVTAAVLQLGSDWHQELARALWSVVSGPEYLPGHRHRAAARLGLIDPRQQSDAEEFLRWNPPSELPDAAAAARIRDDVASAWRRIEACLAEHAPALLAGLGGPASRAEIAAAQAALGFELPVDFAASVAIHRHVAIPGLLLDDVRHEDLAGLAGARDELVEQDAPWGDGSRPEGEVRDDWAWSPGWIPLVAEGDGSYVVLDLDPGLDGRYGQIAYSDQGCPLDDVRAPSWLAVLTGFADALEAGRYRVEASSGGLRDDRIR